MRRRRPTAKKEAEAKEAAEAEHMDRAWAVLTGTLGLKHSGELERTQTHAKELADKDAELADEKRKVAEQAAELTAQAAELEQLRARLAGFEGEPPAK
eukprot:COSAG04_NODE_91_length_26852_cov_8.609315_11_plen_98_part_00